MPDEKSIPAPAEPPARPEPYMYTESYVASLRAQLAQAEDDQKLLKWVYGKCRAYPQHTGAEPDVTMYGMMHRVFYKASCADTYQRIALEQQEKVKVAEAALAQAQQERDALIEELTALYKESTGHVGTITIAKEIIAEFRKSQRQTEAALRIAAQEGKRGTGA